MTDYIGNMTNKAFRKSKLSVIQFIQKLEQKGLVFDCSKTSYHTIDNDEIVFLYFAGGQWNAKY